MENTVVGVSFYIYSDDYFDVNIITQYLGIEPTSTKTKGQLRKFGKSRYPFTNWVWTIEKEISDNINNQLNKLITVFRDKKEQLMFIKNDVFHDKCIDYSVGFVVEVENNEVPALYFDLEALKFFSSIQSPIDIDLYIYS